MAREVFRAGNMLYPLPAVLVSCGDKEGNKNMLTIAWTGTVCSDPAMVYISVRKERHSYQMIKESGEFVINLTTKDLIKATDYAGVRSGRDEDKFKTLNLTPLKGEKVKYAPTIKESPVSIECKVTSANDLGSHTMFLAEVLCVCVDTDYMDEKGTLRLNDAGLISYCHGTYRSLGEKLGTFGCSVRKKKTKKRKRKKK